MEIIVADEGDIKELAQVEIESKKQSIPELMEDIEIDYVSRIYRWKTYLKDNLRKIQSQKKLFIYNLRNPEVTFKFA